MSVGIVTFRPRFYQHFQLRRITARGSGGPFSAYADPSSSSGSVGRSTKSVVYRMLYENSFTNDTSVWLLKFENVVLVICHNTYMSMLVMDAMQYI